MGRVAARRNKGHLDGQLDERSTRVGLLAVINDEGDFNAAGGFPYGQSRELLLRLSRLAVMEAR